MVDALALNSDEGRSVAAIRFGEARSNLWSGDVRMGKPNWVNLNYFSILAEERTWWSKTFQ